MDDLINRLERWGADAGLQNHFIGSRSARKDCAEAAASLTEAQAEIERLRSERYMLAFMGKTLQGWTLHDVMVNSEGAFSAISAISDRLVALNTPETAPPE